MITIIKTIYHPDGTRTDTVACNHADVDAPENAEIWAAVTTDAAKRYFKDADPVTGEVGILEMYDADSSTWIPQPKGSGGGGGDETGPLSDEDIEDGWGA